MNDGDLDRSADKVVRFLGLVAVVLFTLLVPATIIHLAVDSAWTDATWTAVGASFGLFLLAYLGNGGGKTVVGPSAPGRALSAAERVGRIGLTLLTLWVLGNVLENFWDPRPYALELAHQILIGGFALCFVLYVILRYRQSRNRGRPAPPGDPRS